MRKWEKVLAPYGDLYLQMIEMITATDDASLRTLVRACRKPTTTNCPWQIYRIAPSVQHLAGQEIMRRRYAKKQAKKDKEE